MTQPFTMHQGLLEGRRGATPHHAPGMVGGEERCNNSSPCTRVGWGGGDVQQLFTMHQGWLEGRRGVTLLHHAPGMVGGRCHTPSPCTRDGWRERDVPQPFTLYVLTEGGGGHTMHLGCLQGYYNPAPFHGGGRPGGGGGGRRG